MMNIKYFDINKNVCEGELLGTDQNQFGKVIYIVNSLEFGIVEVPARFLISIKNTNSILNETLLSEVNLTVRTYNVLRRGGFITLEEIAEINIDELISLRNMSLRTLTEIANAIKNINSEFSTIINSYVEAQQKITK